MGHMCATCNRQIAYFAEAILVGPTLILVRLRPRAQPARTPEIPPRRTLLAGEPPWWPPKCPDVQWTAPTTTPGVGRGLKTCSATRMFTKGRSFAFRVPEAPPWPPSCVDQYGNEYYGVSKLILLGPPALISKITCEIELTTARGISIRRFLRLPLTVATTKR